MGVHTPIDIFGGFAAGLFLLWIWIYIVDLERYSTVMIQAMLWTVLLSLHPKPLQHTPTYTWTVVFAGVSFGMAMGLRGQLPLDASPLPPLPTDMWWGLRWVGAASWRLLVGLVFALCMQLGTKYVAFHVLQRFFAAMPLELRLMLQPPCHNFVDNKLAQKGIPHNERGHPWDVSLGARFLSYAALAWAVSTAPACFQVIAGLMRR
eukprot:jgi/Botrbrau1/12644/Bobra.67_1s0010.1